LIEVTLPHFSNLIGKDLVIDYRNFNIIGGYLLVSTTLGFVAGIYHALYTSRQYPFSIITSRRETGKLRKFLVIGQFAISAFLLMGSLGVNSQISYMNKKDLGFDSDDIVVIRNRDSRSFGPYFDAFKRDLVSKNSILNVTATTGQGTIGGIPGKLATGDKEIQVEWIGTNYEFLDLFDINIIEGRPFSPEYSTDVRSAFIINETARKQLGISSPLGANVSIQPLNRDGEIIGIVDDFHFKSLHERIIPMVLVMMSESATPFISVRIRPGSYREALDQIETSWKKFAPGIPLEYFFLDQVIEQQYEKELQYYRTLGFSSFIAILLSCMGLFGLVNFMITKRIKEIGLRKVLGAKVSGILVLLIREYLKLVIIGIAIAVPVVYHLLANWLRQFAYRTNIEIGLFLLSTGIIMLITVITVSFKTVKAATVSPVQSLRTE